MTRYLAPLGVVFALATTAHAQNYVTQSYTQTDAYGNSVTTTVQAPSSVAGLIANQAFNNGGYVNGGGYINGGYANGGGYINGGYANGGFNTYYGGNSPVYYGNYPSYNGGYGGYAGYPNYGNYYGNNGYYGRGAYCPPTQQFPLPAPVTPPAQAQSSSPAANFPYGYTPRTYVPGQSNRGANPGVIYNSMSITPNLR